MQYNIHKRTVFGIVFIKKIIFLEFIVLLTINILGFMDSLANDDALWIDLKI